MKRYIFIALILLASAGIVSAQTINGITYNPTVVITTTATLAPINCGVPITVTAAADGTITTLPLAATVPGCEYKVSYVGANGGALVTLTPNAADGIFGGCTLAASVVTFSGTGGAAVKLTKATGLKGDTITLTACGTTLWCVSACQGIWAN